MSSVLEKIHAEELVLLREFDRICSSLGLTYYLSCGTLLGAVRHKGFIPWDEDLDVMMPRDDYEKFVEKAPEMLSSEVRLDDISTNSLYFNPFAKLRLKNTAFEIRSLREYKGGQELWLDIFPMDSAEAADSPALRRRAAVIGICRSVICAKRGILERNSLSKKQRLAVAVLRLLPEHLLWKKMSSAHRGDDSLENYVIFDTDYDYKRLVMPKAWFSPAERLPFEDGAYSAPHEGDSVLTHVYGDYMQLPPPDKQVTFYPERIVFSDGEEVIIREGDRP